MRWTWCICAVVALAVFSWSADDSRTVLAACPAGVPSRVSCDPSPKDIKQARSAFAKALKLQRDKQTEEAYEEFRVATQLAPRNVEYLTGRELARQQLVTNHLEQGNTELLKGREVEALSAFRSALELDPDNQFAQQRMQDALAEWAPKTAVPARVVEDADEVYLAPSSQRADFHFRGDSRELFSQIANTFGVAASVDESVAPRRIRFDIDSVDFFTAVQAACSMTHAFWTPLRNKQFLVASNTPENRRQFDRMALRTFYFPGITAPTDLTDVMNLLRNLFDIRFINPQLQAGTLTVRAPRTILDAATQFIQNLPDSRPQVMLDVTVYQVSHTFTRNIGLHLPTQFNLFNIPAGALAALGGQSIQSLVNQLIANGGINQANSQSISALLAQLQGQQNSIFSQPLATFGGGLTFSGLSLGTLTAQASLNESSVRTLEHATLRVAQGNDANFRMGSRFPVLNATYAPIYNTPAISRVLQNNSFQAAFPSFNYEDIGLTVKAKPMVSGTSDVNLQLEMQLRTLTGQSVNGVPIISNREYKGSITLIDGEPAVVAGSVSHSEVRSLSGLPGLGAISVLNQAMVSNSKQVDDDELLLVITPRVVSHAPKNENYEVWMAK
ncbi:MAG: hypothetical protein NVS1B11_05860 [Terriglobales bacterium]